MTQKSTKIVATLGPASTDRNVLTRMIAGGVDVVRMNFSHGTKEEHLARAELVRDVSRSLERTVGIMCDLQGPKIRIGKFETGRITLNNGDTFTLDADVPIGDQHQVGLDYKELPRDVAAGAVLLLDDGRLVLDVQKVQGSRITTTVRVGGVLSNNKGINRQGGGLTAPALTAKDMEDIKTSVAMRADFLAVSFPKSGADMYMARELMRAAGGRSMLIAKMERTEAIVAMEEIIESCDGIMVARGDLAVEVGDASVPALQKRMIRAARERNKLTITATQMMESMITSPVPTRAEVSDVANAVLDGTDAVMLSAETAVGDYPVEAVEAMSRISRAIETSSRYHDLPRVRFREAEPTFSNATAMAAAQAAEALGIHKIICFTESGNTVRLLSRYRAEAEIIALTPSERTLNGMTILSHVTPMLFRQELSLEDMLHEAQALLLERGLVLQGEEVIFVAGVPPGVSRSTNVMKLHRIGEMTRMH